ncbi:hypothetical protein TWF696_002630 [Orbilia brochopaga]|uniref:6,7-dimethyl-8-ribityllumazine synthase n=1 Tax=Orbilia brochopaga TaxID=3140254 RepID=A0AAV9U684_9PEZI
MRVRSAIHHLAIGLCALPSTFVYAATASMAITDFNDWVLNDPVNAPIWLQLTENLQAFLAGAVYTHNLNIALGPDMNEPMSLGTLFSDLRILFDEIGAREASKNAQNEEVVVVDTTGVRTEVTEAAAPTQNFWTTSVADLQKEFEEWSVTIRHRVWEDRRGRNYAVRSLLIDAVNDLAQYLQYNVDLSDPTHIAIWVLDGRTGVVAGDVITYDTASREKLRAPFSVIGTAFGHLAALVTTLYTSAAGRLTDASDRWYLAQVEDSLRRLQNFCSNLRIAIVHARWNASLIEPLVAGAISRLTKLGVLPDNIITTSVPGSWELPVAVQRIYAGSQVQGAASGISGGGDLLGSATDLPSLAVSGTGETGSSGDGLLSAGGRKGVSASADGASVGGGGKVKEGAFDAIIAIGVLIKGETMHFEHIAESVSRGLMRVQLDFGVPVVFGLLTVLDEDQAKKRAGLTADGHNHGEDWGDAAVEMAVKRKQWGDGAIVTERTV